MGWYAFAKKEMEKKKYSGVIAALWIPTSDAKKLALTRDDLQGISGADPETFDTLHITLCYIGDSSALEGEKSKISRVVKEWAATSGTKKIEGLVSGIGRFYTTDDAPEALYASFDSAALPSLRQSLVDSLNANGIKIDERHGFTPHITLTYLPKMADTPNIRVSTQKIQFDSLALAWAGEQTHYPLG